MIFLLSILGCTTCCAPEPVEVTPKQESDDFEVIQGIGVDEDGGILNCDQHPDSKDCYVPPKVYRMPRYRK